MKYLLKHHSKFVVFFFLSLAFSFAGEKEGVDGSTAIQMLKEGNKRYVSNLFKTKNFKTDRQEQAQGQQPYAIVLTCADSRVPPEILFDESLGKLFVVRVAGNVVDPIVIGSVEYAAEHLHAKLLVILGHSSCGAVKATIQGSEFPPNIKAIVDRIQPSVDKVKSKEKNADAVLTKSIDENIREQIELTKQSSTILTEMIDHKEFTVVGAVYDIKTGEVSFFR